MTDSIEENPEDEGDEALSEIEKLRIEFEANLFQQEHRLFALLRDFFVRCHEFVQGDPRADAIRNALIWHLQRPPLMDGSMS